MEKEQYKELLRESMRLQKEAAALSERLEHAVLGHPPLQEGEVEQLRLSSTGGTVSRAGLQNLLLRVRVFLKTIESAGAEAAALHEKCVQVQKSLQELLRQQAPQASQDLIQGQSMHTLPDPGQQQEQRALQDRFFSLNLTTALLTQTQAQAQTVSGSYRDLEKTLALAAKASGTTRDVKLQEAAVHARRLFAAQGHGT